MITSTPIVELDETKTSPINSIVQKEVSGDDPTVFADIYLKQNNIAIWRRDLSDLVKTETAQFVADHDLFERNASIAANSALFSLLSLLGGDKYAALAEDIAGLVEMYSYLFDIERVGLRLAILNRAMCPKFHVDNVPCRLVCTYHGIATEWLPHHAVNRKKLGVGSNGLADHESGLYTDEADINRLNLGDVALLKGELWQGNEGAGLVHRSPTPSNNEQRLLLSLDFSI